MSENNIKGTTSVTVQSWFIIPLTTIFSQTFIQTSYILQFLLDVQASSLFDAEVFCCKMTFLNAKSSKFSMKVQEYKIKPHLIVMIITYFINMNKILFLDTVLLKKNGDRNLLQSCSRSTFITTLNGEGCLQHITIAII